MKESVLSLKGKNNTTYFQIVHMYLTIYKTKLLSINFDDFSIR